MPLMSPLLWEGTPYRHPEGVLDFLGAHDRWHAILANFVGGVPQYRFDHLDELADIHQRTHEQLATKFGLTAPADFSLYDITQRQGFILFMQAHSVEHNRLRTAARF